MKLDLKENILLKDYATFKIGGPARYFFQVTELEQLAEAARWAKDHNQKVFVLGGGSNVLFSDEGFDGLVIQMKNGRCLAAGKENPDGLRTIMCQAGVTMAALGGFALDNGLSGLEWAAGIPGTVGGAIRGNAGAFGGEMKDRIGQVRAISFEKATIEDENKPNDPLRTFPNHECAFGYRDSFFKREPSWVIWDAEIVLEPADSQSIRQKAMETVTKRRSKQPELAKYASAGSVFKNPTVSQAVIDEFEHDKETKSSDGSVPAGWLIERCGLKGKRIGGALVSDIQANFILNDGTATARDVLMLISLIKQKVRSHFKVQLQEEIEIVL